MHTFVGVVFLRKLYVGRAATAIAQLHLQQRQTKQLTMRPRATQHTQSHSSHPQPLTALTW